MQARDLVAMFMESPLSLLQNVAAGFSLPLHSLESLCHQGIIRQLRRFSVL
ncbi:MAG: hypothetical protein M1438_02770 [Deltaproteobacteria bacterium]|nr:hypothetical protein [Deltaproteobacteria bacterium]